MTELYKSDPRALSAKSSTCWDSSVLDLTTAYIVSLVSLLIISINLLGISL